MTGEVFASFVSNFYMTELCKANTSATQSRPEIDFVVFQSCFGSLRIEIVFPLSPWVSIFFILSNFDSNRL